MFVLHELSTAKEYAEMCGVEVSTINYRHKKGSISSVRIGTHIFVDSNDSPPEKFLSYHNKKPVHRIVLPNNINPKDLVSISSYIAQKKVRGDIYYGLAMMDKIQSIVIGNIAFMLKQEAEKIPIKHYKRAY